MLCFVAGQNQQHGLKYSNNVIVSKLVPQDFCHCNETANKHCPCCSTHTAFNNSIPFYLLHILDSSSSSASTQLAVGSCH